MLNVKSKLYIIYSMTPFLLNTVSFKKKIGYKYIYPSVKRRLSLMVDCD